MVWQRKYERSGATVPSDLMMSDVFPVVQVSPIDRVRACLILPRSVVRSAIGDIPLCLGGEVDCVQGVVGVCR